MFSGCQTFLYVLLRETTMATNEETNDTPIGLRISASLHARIVEEQERVKKRADGIEQSFSDVVRMLIEKGLEANGKRSR
jgi:hypothetical protein